MTSSDTVFAGSIPSLYDHYLGPLLFEPYAGELAKRAATFSPQRILETAAGTGIVTRALHRELPNAEIVATDLNPAMLDVARGRVQSVRVRFQSANALDLPFDEGGFDLVVCQFGVMFFPNKVKGNAEARRVLRDGGHFILAIWDSIERNPASKIVHDAVAALYPDNPPSFLARTPFGYSDPDSIERDLRAAGFTRVDINTVALHGQPTSAFDAARGLVAGCPLASEVQERDPGGVQAAIEAAAQALGAAEKNSLARLSAHIVTAIR